MWGNCAIITTISILDFIIVTQRQGREEERTKSRDSRRKQYLHLISTKSLGLKQGKSKKESNLLLFDTMDVRGVPSAATSALGDKVMVVK